MVVSEEAGARARLVEIRMADGETVEARLEGDAGDDSLLAALDERLAAEQYVRLGDTVVRSQDVRLLRLRDDDGERPGLMESLLGKGEDDGMETTEQGRTMTPRPGHRSGGTRMQQRWLDRPHRGETTPFAWTSEFLSVIAGTLAIAICAAVFDALDVRMALILITGLTGAYILSRGIAKAGTPYVAPTRGWSDGSDGS